MTLPNPIKDEVTLLNRALIAGEKNLPMAILPAVIRVQHPDSEFGYAWDPVECRLLFAWRGSAPGELVYVADGPGPISATIGVWGSPEYFGYRMVDGVPEFLYRLGKIAVEERLVPSGDGKTLVHHWKVYQAEFGVLFTLPERCRPFVRPSTGNWSGAFLDLPQGRARKFSLTWTWPDTPELPELSEAWLLAHTAVTESTESNEVDEAERGQENSEAGETSTPDAE